jgi:hypothetical protein
MVGEGGSLPAGGAGRRGYRAVAAWPLGPRAAPPKIKLRKMANFKNHKNDVLRTTFYHAFHHNLPRFHHPKTWWKSQNPLQKRPFHPPEIFSAKTVESKHGNQLERRSGLLSER